MSESTSDKSGLTPFLATDPDDERVSREELVEAVRALIRERDYLREIRDVQLAEHVTELATADEQVKEMRRLYGSERRAFREQSESAKRELSAHEGRVLALRRARDEWRERAQELEQELSAHRTQMAALRQEFDTHRARTAALEPELEQHRVQAAKLLQELDALRAQTGALVEERDALRKDHEELLEDRRVWRERATEAEAEVARSLWGRVSRIFGRSPHRRRSTQS